MLGPPKLRRLDESVTISLEALVPPSLEVLVCAQAALGDHAGAVETLRTLPPEVR